MPGRIPRPVYAPPPFPSSCTPFKVKLDFPRFGGGEGEDSISFIKCCEEYLAIHPLTDNKILATLPSVLYHTAKDWWIAEKIRVKSWPVCKSTLMEAFLMENHDMEAEKRVREENIRDFAFQY